ncbi:MAG: lipopolysaccharide biosynthesis protein [Phycisphaerae bacterium]
MNPAVPNPDQPIESAQQPLPTIAPNASLRRGAIAVFLGNGVFNLCRIGVIVLLVKFAGEAVLGEFNHAVALSAPIVIALALELRSVYVADARDATPFAVYLALRTLGMCIAAGALLLWTLPYLFTGGNLALWIVLAGGCIAKVLLHQADIYWGVYQKAERLDLLAWANALRGLVMFATFAICIVIARAASTDATRDQSIAIAAAVATLIQVAGWALITLLMERRFARRYVSSSPTWTWPQLRTLALQAFPLALAVGVVSLADNVPLLLIRAQEGGRDALAYYGALLYVPMAAQFIVIQFGNAATNRLAQTFQHDIRRFRKLAALLISGSVAVGAAAVLIVWMLGDPLLRVLYSPAYVPHYASFLIIVLAQAILLPGAILGFIVTQMRMFWAQVPLQLTVLLVTVAASLWLIPGDPIRGAANALLIRAITQTTLYAAAAIVALRRA